MEEKSYPVWNVNVKWSQPGFQREEYPNWYKGLGPNRIWNAVGTTQSFREVKTEEEVKVYFSDWWKTQLKNICEKGKFTEEDVQDLTLTIEFKGNQTWWLRWFDHMSFNRFENEENAFKSFEKFLNSKHIDIKYGHYSHEFNRPLNSSEYCAMGGEDRWRWEYCACEKCKENNITIINH